MIPNNTTSKQERTSKEKPSCRKCGATDINFEYTDYFSGQEIDEVGALRQAIYYVATTAKEEVDQGGTDANALKLMGGALFELAAMLEVRDSSDEEHEKPTDEARP